MRFLFLFESCPQARSEAVPLSALLTKPSWPKMSDFLQLDFVAIGFFVELHVNQFAGRRRKNFKEVRSSVWIVCDDFENLIGFHLSQYLGHLQEGERSNGLSEIQNVISFVFKTCRTQWAAPLVRLQLKPTTQS